MYTVDTGDHLSLSTTYCERHIIQNAVFCEERFDKNHALNIHLTYKDVLKSFSEWVDQQIA